MGGDRVKTYHLLRHLAGSHRVILITFHHGGPAPSEKIKAITDLGVDVRTIPLNPYLAGLSALRTVWTSLPLEIAFYTQPSFSRVVDQVLASEAVDVVISFFMRTAEYVRRKNGIRKILIAEDCRVLYQERSAQAAISPLQRLVRSWETTKLRTYEPEVSKDFDVTTLVSQHDLEAMRKANPFARYTVVTNGVDADRFSFHAEQSDRSGLLFCGKLDVQANHLMALSIVQTMMPLIRQQVPNVALDVVGARPLPELVAAVKGVATLHSNVPDVVPYLHRAAVFLHPHRGGSGIQNKVLEAMASGCAVVTTPSGLQGINAVHDVHCLVGESPRELADLAIRLLRDPEHRSNLAYRARMLMETEHGWDRIGEQLDSVLRGTQPTRKPVSA